ncbi:MAG: long-chain fatty acid--CoA ligase, partial [Proteobacteria bacterium]|nr:long-chain fatty acid--CoA ligase [Pseudomonadota bacterium]
QRKYVSNCLVHGDKRKYLVALITLDPDDLAQSLGDGIRSPEGLALQADRVRELIQAQVDAVNAELAPFEQIKYFHLCPRDFDVETGELTQTLKLKRRVIEATYRAELDAMYPDEPR